MKKSDISVEYIQHCGSDLMVVNAARVSMDKQSEWEEELFQYQTGGQSIMRRNVLSERDQKLISYLANHKHTSPFNHSFVTLRVKAPIFVARQLVKHKFMPWNEVSRRYVVDDLEFYFPEKWRAKADNVKQGSDESKEIDVTLYGMDYFWDVPVDSVETALEGYNVLIEKGVCPEQARMILPQNLMTQWFWSGTLGAWADMLRLRLDSHTQYESRIVAQKARDIIEPLFPVSVNALLQNV